MIKYLNMDNHVFILTFILIKFTHHDNVIKNFITNFK